jgi:hypothetical protein
LLNFYQSGFLSILHNKSIFNHNSIAKVYILYIDSTITSLTTSLDSYTATNVTGTLGSYWSTLNNGGAGYSLTSLLSPSVNLKEYTLTNDYYLDADYLRAGSNLGQQ